MFLKIMTSMGGPTLSLTYGDEVPFGDDFPFSNSEVRRFLDAGTAELVGAADEIAAWLKANPSVAEVEVADSQDTTDAMVATDPPTAVDATPAVVETSAAEVAAADTAPVETAPAPAIVEITEAAVAPAPKVAAKAAAKKAK